MRKYQEVAVMFLIVAVSLPSVLPETQKNTLNDSESAAERCFCELQGQVDDCTCKVETISTFNNLRLFPRLNSLLERNYFKFYKVNLKRTCPFWPDDGGCAFESCSVCPCTDDEVPCGLKDEDEEVEENKYSAEANTQEDAQSCTEGRSDKEIRLSALDTTISKENQEVIETWREHDDAQLNFCYSTDDHSADMEYVDLTINPERYTGYKGDSPHRIWNSIYRENCFKPDPKASTYEDILSNKIIKGLCLEKRAFYRLISGLHSSINIHLSAKYLISEHMMPGTKETWGPNDREFQQRFDPKTSDGQGPIRLKNLFFTYLVVLRAIVKAKPLLEKESFYTGIAGEDKEVKTGVLNIIDLAKKFPDHFNESLMFQGNSKEALQLKEEFRMHFWNISRIMDCVGCDKCKLWGKLQIHGLGTALKILFTPGNRLRLNRQEIVALFNGFGRLSSSVKELEDFQMRLGKNSNKNKKARSAGGFF